VVTANKCTSSAGRFDGHGGALEQYRWQRLMRHDQGYSGSHWTPALGNYLLRITPAATRAPGIQTTINKYTCKAGHFDGHGNAPVCNRVHCPMEEVQSFTRSHWTLPSGKYYAQYHSADMATMVFFNVFIVKTVGKGHGLTLRTLFLIGV
jgi:hypothetical protein